jgi:hypothetical protein
MTISELLLPEFDDEINKTRITLERFPAGETDFAPHPKSMPMGRLASLVAQLGGFAVSILTMPELDFSKGGSKSVQADSAAQLVALLDEGARNARAALVGLPDAAWNENWKLLMKGKSLFDGSRFLAYRQMFLNHMVHHRAQLGVYLRLTNQPVPAIYGPSADDTLGF